MTVHVMVVDDHPLVLEGIRALLDGDPDMEVVATAGNITEALREVERTSPDVVLLDVQLASESGLDLIGRVLEIVPTARVMMLTVADDAYTVQESLRRGAKGYVLKGDSADEIRAAVHRVATGFAHIDPGVSGHLLTKAMHRSGNEEPEVRITRRELDVLRLAAKGLTNESIARDLGVTVETVKTHLSRAFARLGAKDRAHAVAIGMRKGLL
ncbi:MAG: response regulator transcription factor [Coriobacteriia bacterium]